MHNWIGILEEMYSLVCCDNQGKFYYDICLLLNFKLLLSASKLQFLYLYKNHIWFQKFFFFLLRKKIKFMTKKTPLKDKNLLHLILKSVHVIKRFKNSLNLLKIFDSYPFRKFFLVILVLLYYIHQHYKLIFINVCGFHSISKHFDYT